MLLSRPYSTPPISRSSKEVLKPAFLPVRKRFFVFLHLFNSLISEIFLGKCE
jgi:hypothetical protein